MLIKLNTTTNYGGKSLKPGDEIDVPLNISQRWIFKGIAQPVIEDVKPTKPAVFIEPDIRFEVIKKAKKNKKKINGSSNNKYWDDI